MNFLHLNIKGKVHTTIGANWLHLEIGFALAVCPNWLVIFLNLNIDGDSPPQFIVIGCMTQMAVLWPFRN